MLSLNLKLLWNKQIETRKNLQNKSVLLCGKTNPKGQQTSTAHYVKHILKKEMGRFNRKKELIAKFKYI